MNLLAYIMKNRPHGAACPWLQADSHPAVHATWWRAWRGLAGGGCQGKLLSWKYIVGALRMIEKKSVTSLSVISKKHLHGADKTGQHQLLGHAM